MPSERQVSYAGWAGRGVRVAVIDSGVEARHPHVESIAGGVGIGEDGSFSSDFVDRLGHGTAVAAAIREKAPGASLYAVRVFGASLTASITTLLAAIDWAVTSRMHIVNLSLGTSEVQHEPALRAAVDRATAAGVLIVAARDDEGIRCFPGSLPGVISVRADANCPRDDFRVDREYNAVVFRASPFARPISPIPQAGSRDGISFAVANMTGFLAGRLEPNHARYTLAEAVRVLTPEPLDDPELPFVPTNDGFIAASSN
jgi:subtilisin family serine protease